MGLGGSVLIQQVKMLLVTLEPHIGVLVQHSATLLLIQLPAKVPEKTVENSPRTWNPASHVGDLVGVPGF